MYKKTTSLLAIMKMSSQGGFTIFSVFSFVCYLLVNKFPFEGDVFACFCICDRQIDVLYPAIDKKAFRFICIR